MALDDAPDFITGQLIPTLRAAGLPTRVYDLDASGFTSETQYLTAHPSYRAAIAGSAVHCYAGLEQMSQLHGANPGGSLIESECSPGIVTYPTPEIAIASLRNWSQAVELWNLALDPHDGPKQHAPGCNRCSGLVTINQRTHPRTQRQLLPTRTNLEIRAPRSRTNRIRPLGIRLRPGHHHQLRRHPRTRQRRAPQPRRNESAHRLQQQPTPNPLPSRMARTSV